ncbi:diaminopimelate dehydrogenase [Scatolibacter rhodanostii]|uniref:diaminopimelate dehydrogenase n=1 Tax=Scatolibacter rhodanostii TaxID=2014781 RepID=UPI000C06C105|nr:diaminopimelate dehydrogenase [Scatolibacter rhodanostii]
MEKIRIAIVGYGNIGKYAVEAVEAAEDMELAGIVRRTIGGEQPKELQDIKVTDDISELGKVDVALLCTPTRSVQENAEKFLAMGICTVDSFDIHTSIVELRRNLDKAAKASGAAAILSAGWDPGSDSIVRTLMQACAPKGITYTNFGPGMSMGHTVAAKAVAGVKGALSMTIPLGTGVHRRMVYVELEENAVFADVEKGIKGDAYFTHDETHVIEVSDINTVIDKGHGVHMVRKGVSGETDNQIFEFNMTINNPALTSQVLVACARAVTKQKPGAYTMIEIPVIDLLPGDREALVAALV